MAVDGVFVELLAANQRDIRVDQGRLHEGVARFLARPYGKLGGLGAFTLQLRQRTVDSIMHQHAAIDADELPGLTVHEPQVALPADGEPSVVAVAVMDGRRRHRRYRWISYVPHSPQSVGHFFPLDGQLVVVVHVLPLASGAHAVVGAGRLDPKFRRLQHLNHRCRSVFTVDPNDLGNDLLSRYTAGHENVRLSPLARGFAQAAPGSQVQGYLLAFN